MTEHESPTSIEAVPPHAVPRPVPATVDAAAAARAAADRTGVVVRSLHELADLHAVCALIDSIWKPHRTNPLVTVEQLRAMTHAGNYLAGAFDHDAMVGACVGFFGAPPGVGLHSHIAGVSERVRRRSVGFALKLHQRAWALERGLSNITWTFDPLVRRNAYFNLAKLGALARDYLVDFYGDTGDAINAGQGSDRLFVAWELSSTRVVQACAARPVEVDVETAGTHDSVVRTALSVAPSGGPQPAPRRTWESADRLLVTVPADIEAIRRTDHRMAVAWRLAVRDVLGDALAEDARITGFSRNGYIVERRRQ